MGIWTTSALLALLVAGWVYQKIRRRSASGSYQPLVVAFFVWLLAFLVLTSLLSAFWAAKTIE